MTDISPDPEAELLSLRTILDEIGAYIYAKDLRGCYTYVNQRVLSQFHRTLDEVIDNDDGVFFDLASSDQLKQNDRYVLETGETVVREETNFVLPTGEKRVYWTVKKPVRDADGHIIGMCGISTDITEQKELRARAEQQQTLLETVLNNVDALIYMKDDQRRFHYANQKVAQVFGRSQAEIVGCLDSELVPEALADQFWQLDQKVFATGHSQASEESLTGPDGKVRHYGSHKVPLDLVSTVKTLIGFSSDITELYDLKEQLRLQSITDALTGLANRRQFFDLAMQACSASLRHRRPLTLLMLDLDHFKDVNDLYGHPAGDTVLQSFARLLQDAVRREDIVGRVGGEEFAVLLPDTATAEAEGLAERILAAIRVQYYVVEEHELTVTASIGVAERRTTDTSFDALYSRADRLLYEAKHLGRDRICYAERH
ncbi:sensor domain-containing diguanylate cyclase [Chitinolyticbacter albus]|uniref:sensor domain-containing diguanylate cyclase n=1 Tax=Chitinolyticbacter albus TaxID=2961951 RepID=UPI00210CEE6A|nr:diguanylate cyclase [Chitinolyticbacter albus]